MVNIVHADTVDMTLTDIAHITETQGGTIELQIQRQQLSEAERIARMRETYVVVATALGDIIIALSELGTEHTTHQREVCLIVQQDRQPANPELVATSCRSRHIQTESALSRIVGVAGIVKETQIYPQQATSL